MGDMVFPGGLWPGGLPAALPAPERLAAVRAPAGRYSDSLTHIHPRDSSCTARTR
jgi:hypothetical protein